MLSTLPATKVSSLDPVRVTCLVHAGRHLREGDPCCFDDDIQALRTFGTRSSNSLRRATGRFGAMDTASAPTTSLKGGTLSRKPGGVLDAAGLRGGWCASTEASLIGPGSSQRRFSVRLALGRSRYVRFAPWRHAGRPIPPVSTASVTGTEHAGRIRSSERERLPPVQIYAKPAPRTSTSLEGSVAAQRRDAMMGGCGHRGAKVASPAEGTDDEWRMRSTRFLPV